MKTRRILSSLFIPLYRNTPAKSQIVGNVLSFKSELNVWSSGSDVFQVFGLSIYSQSLPESQLQK
jgi:hypothetical protein